jgi:AraC-like DNA-binding protein
MKIVIKKFDIPTDLQPYLDSVWYCAGEGAETEMSPVHFCLPTGMSELIIHLTPHRHSVKWRGKWTQFPEAFLVGVQTEPAQWMMPGGTVMMGITIKPEMFWHLFNRSISELADDCTDVKNFLGTEINDFIKDLSTEPEAESALQKTVQYFRNRVSKVKKDRERNYLPEAVQYIRLATGTQSVDEVCGKVFVGKRQLQRAFQEFIGISPKTYGRIVRFKSAYDFVRQFPQASWLDVTYNFGYADQSHFIRDFKEFAGENPTAFMSEFVPQEKMPFAVKMG